jgi:phage terminase small subunit
VADAVKFQEPVEGAEPLARRQWEKFAQEYALTDPLISATEAARRAGYGRTSKTGVSVTACRLLKQPTISARVRWLAVHRAAQVVRAKIASVVEKQEILTAIIRGEVNEVEHRKGKERGEETDLTVTAPVRPAVRIAAIKESNEMEGLYPEKRMKVSLHDLLKDAGGIQFDVDIGTEKGPAMIEGEVIEKRAGKRTAEAGRGAEKNADKST